MDANVPIRRALLSVYDKTGLLELSRLLIKFGVEIISTGGTYKLLAENNIPVIKVSEVTRFPEILSGRVKTLHPYIHGGILAKRNAEHLAELKQHHIGPIDLVVVNLYPFEKTVASPDVDLETALENIDIGGPTMIRAAAKNFTAVAVVTDPEQYPALMQDMEANDGAVSTTLRQRFAVEAFVRTAAYDQSIFKYLRGLTPEEEAELPARLPLNLVRVQSLRYGENPHQRAAFYVEADKPAGGIAAAEQYHGKELSFNNILDLNAAMGLALEFDRPAAAIIKHNNPCGVAVADGIAAAYEAALATDPVSAFGGIVAANRLIDGAAAAKIAQVFTEVVVAPEFTFEALDILMQKKNLRIIRWTTTEPRKTGLDMRSVDGGYLIQDLDAVPVDPHQWKVVSKRRPTEAEMRAMEFGWRVAKWVKSNAVIYVNENRTLGIGAGQMSRVDSAKLAALKAAEAGLSLKGSVVVSDAFFPFRDGIDTAAAAGATAVIEPGGSVRDDEVIAAADEHGMALVFTGRRHFRH